MIFCLVGLVEKNVLLKENCFNKTICRFPDIFFSWQFELIWFKTIIVFDYIIWETLKHKKILITTTKSKHGLFFDKSFYFGILNKILLKHLIFRMLLKNFFRRTIWIHAISIFTIKSKVEYHKHATNKKIQKYKKLRKCKNIKKYKKYRKQ